MSSIAPELKEKILELSHNAPPVPEAGESKVEERGTVIAGLEAGAFDDEDNADMDVPLPSRLLSGWVAARIISEGSKRTVQTGAIPLIGRPIITDPNTLPAPSMLGGYPTHAYATISTSSPSIFSPSLLASAAHSRHFGFPRHSASSANASQAAILGGGGVGGTGSSVGLGALRLDLSLSDRIAAIHAKSEERSKRFLVLRRHYLQSLKNYHLEAREQDIAIEQLRTATIEARVKVRGPNRSSKFATDQEEWAAVDRMSMASTAVYFQNVELRMRLAALTNRSSGCDMEEAKLFNDQAVSSTSGVGSVAPSLSSVPPITSSSSQLVNKEVGVKVLTRNSGAVSGGAKAKTKKGEKATSVKTKKMSQSSQSKVAVEDEDDAMHDVVEERGNNNGNDSDDNDLDPYHTRARTEPRRGPRTIKNASETILGVGDLVLSVYGRGVVVRQRDPDKSVPFCMTQILLEWGANAFVMSKSLTLLCVAGEEYLGERSQDATLLQLCGVSRPLKTPSTSALVPQLYNADDLIMEASALSRRQSLAGVPSTATITPVTISSASTTESVTLPLKQSMLSERDDESSAMKDVQSTPPSRGMSRTRRKQSGAGAAASQAPVSVSPEKNRAFRSSATDAADEEGGEEDKEAVKRAVKKLKTKSGKTISMRAPVFVTSWDTYGVPRGVPLRLDPARNATFGFAVAANDFSSSSKFGGGNEGAVRTLSSNDQIHSTALVSYLNETSPRGSSSSALTATGTGENMFKSDHGSKNESSQSRFFGPGSPLHGVSSGDMSSSAADTARLLRAQNERLTFQLRHSEEIREEQRKRLSDTKDSISRILEQLNNERETSRELAEELRVCMLEANEVTARLVSLAKRFDPASPTAQVVLPPLTSSSASSSSFASLVLGSMSLTSGTSDTFVISETSRKRKAGDAPSSASRHTQTIRTHPPHSSSADSDSDGGNEDEAEVSAPVEKSGPQTRSGRNIASLSLGTHNRRSATSRPTEEPQEDSHEADANTDEYDVGESEEGEEETEKGGDATMDDDDEAPLAGVDESDDGLGLAALLELTSVRTRAQRSQDIALSGPASASTAATSSASLTLVKGKKGTRLSVPEATTSGDGGGPKVSGKRRRTQDDFAEDGVSALHAIVADAIVSSEGGLKSRNSNGKETSTLKKSVSLTSSQPHNTSHALGSQTQTHTDINIIDDEVPPSKRTTRQVNKTQTNTESDRRRGSAPTKQNDDEGDDDEALEDTSSQQASKQLQHNRRRK